MPIELKFLDSNIWLYALVKEQDADKHSIARELAQQPGIAVSTQIINEVCFNLYRNKMQTEPELEKLIHGFANPCQRVVFGGHAARSNH